MNYEHILVAVNLAKIDPQVIDRGVSLAKAAGARVSLIYVDISYVDRVAILDDEDVESVHKSKEELARQLQLLADCSDYPITNTLVVSGGLSHKLQETVRKMDVDLLVCGHHHNFWSRIVSAVRELVETSPIDLLIVHLDE
ncbi:universal stress protein [Psychromonas sp.]|uniref:universal stress protein n=1 Tax=Psychromonas sp. TaxID=1884585 RepID=UPI00356B2DF9